MPGPAGGADVVLIFDARGDRVGARADQRAAAADREEARFEATVLGDDPAASLGEEQHGGG